MRLYLSVRDSTWYSAKINPSPVTSHALLSSPPSLFSLFRCGSHFQIPSALKIITTFPDHSLPTSYTSEENEEQNHTIDLCLTVIYTAASVINSITEVIIKYDFFIVNGKPGYMGVTTSHSPKLLNASIWFWGVLLQSSGTVSLNLQTNQTIKLS